METAWYPAIDSRQVEARFFDEERLLPQKTEEMGEDVFQKVTIVQIRVKGISDVTATKLSPAHIKRFPQAYQEYTTGVEQELDGTPIENLPGLPRETAAYWKLQGIRTVEDFAGASMAIVKGLGLNATNLQKTAKIMVDNGAKDKELEELRKLKERVEKLEDEPEAIEEKPAPKRKKGK